MKPTFSMRDLFWFAAVVGVATGWLTTLLVKAPTTAFVRGTVHANGRPFDGRIFLRSSDGLIVSAPVRKGEFHLGHCQHGEFEVIFGGNEVDLQYLNAFQVIEIGGYEQVIRLGSSEFALPVPSEDRRDKDWTRLDLR